MGTEAIIQYIYDVFTIISRHFNFILWAWRRGEDEHEACNSEPIFPLVILKIW